ncbi:integrator complex assembly factor WDR73 [Mastacembelus armatus]|uniref:WD repeat domain 73 n=1 Tax=Mastacembelus armatus TaxID=205130 RepID=A0A3Q3N619_9TELE|nr:WD repeat-containing protein 73 [Mastacembelus armatus]
MDDAEFDDVLDDWFMESLKTYKDLHVYQLEHPTQVIEWTSGKTVCVAGYSSSKNEILELHLPPRLFVEENKGLCAERDFRVVHGGFTDSPIRCLRHIPGTRWAVTNDGLSSDLQLWDLGGDDSDVIRSTGSIGGSTTVPGSCSRVAVPRSSQPHVLHGARSDGVRLSELPSGQTLYESGGVFADPLSSLHFVTDSVFLAACSNGNICVVDTRTPAAPRPSPPPECPGDAAFWWADASSGPHPSSCRIIRLSSSGLALLSDLRNLTAAVGQAQLDVQTQQHSPDSVRVSWGPRLQHCIALSGSSGVVQIYDTAVWTTTLQEAPLLFEHRGHMVSSHDDIITSHAWHPDRPRTLLSAASDGSIHVWDWVDQPAADAELSGTR